MLLPKGCEVLSESSLDTAEFKNQTPAEVNVISVSKRSLESSSASHCASEMKD